MVLTKIPFKLGYSGRIYINCCIDNLSCNTVLNTTVILVVCNCSQLTFILTIKPLVINRLEPIML